MHSYNKIAEKLEEIHMEYGLSKRKIIATVTDNGSNFVKAFKEFGIKEDILFDVDNTEMDSELGNLYLISLLIRYGIIIIFEIIYKICLIILRFIKMYKISYSLFPTSLFVKYIKYLMNIFF